MGSAKAADTVAPYRPSNTYFVGSHPPLSPKLEEEHEEETNASDLSDLRGLFGFDESSGYI